MATAPVKSQPLHNFSLPTYLRWGGGSSSNHHHHRFRRSAPPGESPPAAEGDSDRNESDPDSRPPRAGSRHGRRFFPGGGSASDAERQQGRRDAKEENQRISGKSGEGGAEGGEEAEGEPMEGEAVQRPWNLRPRRANPSPKVAELTEAAAAATPSPVENPAPKSARLRGFADAPAAAGGEKRGEKRRLWMALSKEEIEEDFFAMTGARPSRRPKKRPKHVQKLLSTTFPGLWLIGASADDFRVSDDPAKK